VIIAVLADLFFIGLAVFSLQQSMLQYEARADITTQNLSQVLAEHIADDVDKIDLAVLTVADEVERELAGGGINARLLNAFIVRHNARLPALDGLRVVNARGENAYGIGINPGARTSIADREYFTRLRGDPKAGLVISEPVVGRVSKKWSIILARRVNQPDGSFAGLVYGTITLEHFQTTFSAIDVGRHGSISLRDQDLVQMARYSGPREVINEVGTKRASPELLNAVKSQKNAGTYRTHLGFDNMQRTYSYRKVFKHPLYIIVGLAYDDYLDAWWSEFAWVSALVTLFILGTLISSWLVYRGWMRRESAVRALARQGEALRENEARHGKMFANIGDVIVIIDQDGITRYKSPNIEKLFGWKPEEVIGRSTFENIHPDDLDVAQKFAGSLLGEPNANGTMEARYRCRDGSYRWVEFTAVNLLHDPDIRGLLGNYQDITGRKLAEAERAKLEAQLLQAQKMEAVGQLAGGVAHDFNNILSVIMGFGSLLDMQLKDNDKETQYVSQILQAADRGGALTQSLLAFSRKQRIYPQPMDLNAVIKKTETFLARTIGEDIQVSLQLTDQNTTVHADSNQIEQILMNLAANARDAMPKGGEFTIRTERVSLDEAFITKHGYGRSGDYAVMTVSDSGAGMDAATKKRIFEPFFTTKEVGKGTGLGLSMVYGVVEQHGGFINVDSEVGGGTVFKIYLPALDTRAADYEDNGHFEPEGATETILVVEDNNMLREAMTEMLKAVGYTVIEACDGDDAVTKFLAHKDEIQLVLMDVIMPRKSGGDAYKELRAIQPDLKIILMSGYAGDYLSGKLNMEENVHFMSKPILPKRLFEKIRSVLRG
jgi:PAS domain S-box-containing protein